MLEAGKFDRRIMVQVATESKDGAGDVIKEWIDAFPRFARKQDSAGREFFGAAQVIREADVAFTVRDDSQSRSIAPETHRIIYQDKIFEIVGIAEGAVREDVLLILCGTRPDHRGARGFGESTGA